MQLWGLTGIQKEAVLGAKRSLVTVEEIVDELEPQPNAVVLPRWVVTRVARGPRRRQAVLRAGLLRPRQRRLQAWDAISQATASSSTQWLEAL